jgi:hypothetical protein
VIETCKRRICFYIRRLITTDTCIFHAKNLETLQKVNNGTIFQWFPIEIFYHGADGWCVVMMVGHVSRRSSCIISSLCLLFWWHGSQTELAYSTVGLISDLYTVSFILLLLMFKFRFRNPIVLLALLQIFLMWSFHFRSALIVHPRYLAHCTASSVCPCSWYSRTIDYW